MMQTIQIKFAGCKITMTRYNVTIDLNFVVSGSNIMGICCIILEKGLKSFNIFELHSFQCANRNITQ